MTVYIENFALLSHRVVAAPAPAVPTAGHRLYHDCVGLTSTRYAQLRGELWQYSTGQKRHGHVTCLFNLGPNYIFGINEAR